jgi:hypothetical protein
MCRPASIVLTKDRALWSRHSDSHEDIICENSLLDDANPPDILRVEVVPPGGNWLAPLSKWGTTGIRTSCPRGMMPPSVKLGRVWH